VFNILVAGHLQAVGGNKRLVLATAQALWGGEIEAGLANMADDVTFSIPGAMRTSGLHRGKQAVRELHQSISSVLFRDMQVSVTGLYGDGDAVIMEMTTHGHLRKGELYEQVGCSVWIVKEAKIHEVREYLDTHKAMAVNTSFDAG
jgi:uncharacterized protein